MNYFLPANNMYSNQPVEISLPDAWKVWVCSYRGEHAPAMSGEEIRQVVRSAEICQAAKGCRTAVIVIDDMTRPTPCGEVARAVIDELLAAGVPRQGISIIGATGMHRAMYREDFVRKLGEELTGEYPTYSHNPFFNNIPLGVCSCGIPIELNAESVRADFKVGIGSIFGHPNTGLGGGGKLIVPGIASVETIRRYHLSPREKWNMDLTARQITVEAATMLGLNCKFDALLNGSGQIARLFAGDCAGNLENNLPEILDFFRTPRPEEPVDVVIANNYFKPSEANVVLNYPEFFKLLKPGGDLIVSANSPLGAATHYLFGKWGESGSGGLAYYGEGALPEQIGRYFAFSLYPDRGTSLQYHYAPDTPRFIWADRWEKVAGQLDSGPKTALILPYADVPFFEPAIHAGSVPTLYIGSEELVRKGEGTCSRS